PVICSGWKRIMASVRALGRVPGGVEGMAEERWSAGMGPETVDPDRRAGHEGGAGSTRGSGATECHGACPSRPSPSPLSAGGYFHFLIQVFVRETVNCTGMGGAAPKLCARPIESPHNISPLMMPPPAAMAEGVSVVPVLNRAETFTTIGLIP